MQSSSWTSVLVEDLMETNIIDGRNMAMLKEQANSGFRCDPSVLINLRHDKLVRSSLRLPKSSSYKSEVWVEAKRKIKKEDKDREKIKVQDQIVNEEIRKFENHIVSLRNINKRLTRPSEGCPGKRPERIGKTEKTIIFQDKDASVPEKIEESRQITKVCPESIINPIDKMYNSDGLGKQKECSEPKIKTQLSVFPHKVFKQREREKIAICGSRLEGNEAGLEFHTDPCIHGSAGHQYSIFQQLAHKYAETERLYMLKDKGENIKCSTFSSTEPVPTRLKCIAKDKERVPYMNNDTSLEAESSSSYNTKKITIEKWNAHFESHSVERIGNEEVGKESSRPADITFLSIERKNEKMKLDAMACTYSQWMKSVCEEDSSTSKNAMPKERKVDRSKELMGNNDTKLLNREGKITQVLQVLQRNRETRSNSTQDVSHSHIDRHISKSANDLHDRNPRSEFIKSRRVVSGSYEHRLTAQKDIIVQQKAKLEEQRRQIEEFKLSQLKIETERSRLHAQQTLNDVLQSGDEKAKAHARPLQSSFSFVDWSPQNAFVERMEHRALEQRQKRLLSQERRKQFEEQWRLKIKEEEEKKRQDKEELARKKIEELQERRKMEREAREAARIHRERLIILEKKAFAHSCRRKLKYTFLGFKKLIILRRQQAAKAEKFYLDHLMCTSLKTWKKYADHSIGAKMSIAYEFYELTLMRHCFDNLMKEQELGAIRLQVAVDMHDMRLQDKAFHLWLQITQAQHAVNVEKNRKAEEFHCKILLRKVFGLWLKLPKIAQQEREKEHRKTLLRRKVQQFLPDYRPTISND